MLSLSSSIMARRSEGVTTLLALPPATSTIVLALRGESRAKIVEVIDWCVRIQSNDRLASFLQFGPQLGSPR